MPTIDNKVEVKVVINFEPFIEQCKMIADGLNKLAVELEAKSNEKIVPD